MPFVGRFVYIKFSARKMRPRNKMVILFCYRPSNLHLKFLKGLGSLVGYQKCVKNHNKISHELSGTISPNLSEDPLTLLRDELEN